MIIGSIVLVVGGAVLLIIGAVGTAGDSSGWYLSSIAASGLAAFALVVGVRRLPGVQLPDDDFDLEPAVSVGYRTGITGAMLDQPQRAASRSGAVDQLSVRAGTPVRAGWSTLSDGAGAAAVPGPISAATVDPAAIDPAAVSSPRVGAATVGPATVGPAAVGPAVMDEPREQRVRQTDAIRVAQLDSMIAVIDGRPRYHVPTCGHLLGRTPEPLPVSEAIELGFTPCAECSPVRVLLGGS